MNSNDSKQYSNNAQLIISMIGDVTSKVLIFISLKMDNKTGEFYYSNKKIALNIGHHEISVSKAVGKLEKNSYIQCTYDFNGVSRPRTITWAKDYDWNDISNSYLANSLRVSQNAKGGLNNTLSNLSEKAKTPKPKDLDINTSLNTSTNTSFNEDKKKLIAEEKRLGKI